MAEISDISSIELFLSDLLTAEEKEEISRRYQAVKMLAEKVSYSEIQKQLNMSTTTIARLWRQLKDSSGGFAYIFPKKIPKNFKPKSYLEWYLERRINKGK